jgi:hypothetical protein
MNKFEQTNKLIKLNKSKFILINWMFWYINILGEWTLIILINKNIYVN